MLPAKQTAGSVSRPCDSRLVTVAGVVPWVLRATTRASCQQLRLTCRIVTAVHCRCLARTCGLHVCTCYLRILVMAVYEQALCRWLIFDFLRELFVLYASLPTAEPAGCTFVAGGSLVCCGSTLRCGVQDSLVGCGARLWVRSLHCHIATEHVAAQAKYVVHRGVRMAVSKFMYYRSTCFLLCPHLLPLCAMNS